MKVSQKISGIMLVAGLMFTTAACSGSDNTSVSPEPKGSSTSTETATPEPTSTALDLEGVTYGEKSNAYDKLLPDTETVNILSIEEESIAKYADVKADRTAVKGKVKDSVLDDLEKRIDSMIVTLTGHETTNISYYDASKLAVSELKKLGANDNLEMLSDFKRKDVKKSDATKDVDFLIDLVVPAAVDPYVWSEPAEEGWVPGVTVNGYDSKFSSKKDMRVLDLLDEGVWSFDETGRLKYTRSYDQVAMYVNMEGKHLEIRLPRDLTLYFNTDSSGKLYLEQWYSDMAREFNNSDGWGRIGDNYIYGRVID